MSLGRWCGIGLGDWCSFDAYANDVGMLLQCILLVFVPIFVIVTNISSSSETGIVNNGKCRLQPALLQINEQSWHLRCCRTEKSESLSEGT